MFLIILVLSIIVLIVVVKDHDKDRQHNISEATFNMRKTNAKLERSVVDKFMKQGKTLDEAYEAARNEMIQKGFDPCIPRSEYNGGIYRRHETDIETSFVSDPYQFDSFVVKIRREHEDASYDNFPENEFEYRRDLKRLTVRTRSLPVGTMITYPVYGTCEIVGHIYHEMPISGYYKLKVLKTGDIVTNVKIGDSNIRVIGR